MSPTLPRVQELSLRSGLGLLLALTLALPAQASPDLVEAFVFGSRNLSCETPNAPGTPYTIVLHSSAGDLEYDPGRGWGYVVTNPGDNSRNGYGRFGPFDDSPNNRNAFPDDCASEIYDSFIGAKNWSTPCDSIPCASPEGLVFRIDVPDGTYRFVAAAGEADNPHTTRIIVEDGGVGDPANIGPNHVVLVHNHDQAVHGEGVFARVGFDGLLPPTGTGPGFVDLDEAGLPTGGEASSPTLEVTGGYVHVHQLKAFTEGTDANGGDLVVLELWRVSDTFQAIDRGSQWRYLPGLSEASSPDVGAWRELDFDDSSWSLGQAPFGYGDPPLGTDLSTTVPPMGGNYSSVFLRQKFTLTDASAINQLTLDVDYDDGFAIWINGEELYRINLPGGEGDPLAFDDTANSSHESGLYEQFELPDPSTYLVDGENIVAIQFFNVTLGSSDAKFDAGIFDPVAPDLSPPAISSISPTPGTVVRSLDRVRLTFDEVVLGVDASDLLLDGVPAIQVTGDEMGPYEFIFNPPAAPGNALVTWAAGTGITDLAEPPNPFAGTSSFAYTVDPDAPAGNVVISEFLAAGSSLTDFEGEEEEWLELENQGDTAVDLLGWSLTDDLDEPRKFVLPSRILNPGERLVVFASGKDLTGNEIHASFKLSTGGEPLAIFNSEIPPELVMAYQPRYPRQRAGTSYGLDGTGQGTYFQSPTPGQPNSLGTSIVGFALEPSFSPKRGLYDGPIQVTLATPTPGATIRYTLDGSPPSPTRGTVYSGPISVSGSSQKGAIHVRALAYRDDFLPSDVITHTYVFPDQVVRQSSSPAGFPSNWNGQTADYQMDPDVVNDPGHAQIVLDGLSAIPTLSIVGDVDDIFHASQGFYANPSRSGIGAERPVSAELIYPDGRDGFQINAGIRPQGGSSVNNWKVLKVSMRLLFKGDYGPTKLDFPLYPDARSTRFDTLVLDAHMNQTWNHPSHSQRVKGDYIRDVFMSDVQRHTGGLAPHDVYVNLYLNGLYWGLYEIHERADASFAAENYGGNKSEYDALKHNGNRVVDGSNAAWNQMMSRARQNLGSVSNYENLLDYLDIVDFADYMICNLYGGNTDWPHHNWYATRRRVPGGQFHFHSWDAEHVLKSVSENRIGENDGNTPGEIYTNLRNSAEFRLLFADRVQKHFFNGGTFHVRAPGQDFDPETPEDNVPASIYHRRVVEIDQAIACEAARWGDVRRPSDPYTRNDEWLTEMDWLLNTYFPARSNVVLNQFRSANLFPSIDAPILSQHGGRIDPGFSLSMSRPPGDSGTIYYTLDGTDPREFGTGDVAPTAQTYTSPITLDDTTIVLARLKNGSTWSALTEASFTLTDPLGNLVISEIHYHPATEGEEEFIELRNTTSATIDLGGLTFSNGIIFDFPPGTTLAPGEYAVLVRNFTAFDLRYPGGIRILGQYAGSLDNGGETLRIESATGQVIVEVDYDDGDGWPIAADGFGRSLVSLTGPEELDRASSWRASTAIGGSPGEADPPAPPAGIQISEVLTHPAGPTEDAIELVNLGAQTIDIGGWFLSDSRQSEALLRKFEIPAGTVLGPGDFAVFYEAEFNPTPGSGTSFDLGDTGGAVYLTAVDPGTGLATGTMASAEFRAAEAGTSIGRYLTSQKTIFTRLEAPTFGVNSPVSVADFRLGGGDPNLDPLVGPVVINEIHYNPDGGGEEFIELYNPTGSPISLHEAGLGLGWRLGGILNAFGGEDYEFPAGTEIPAGGYLLVVDVDPALFRTLHAVPGDVEILGPYGGRLDNGGERVSLSRPREDGQAYIRIDEFRYDDDAPWPVAADGNGSSLERLVITRHADDPLNWAASTRVAGTPGAENSTSTGGGNRAPRAIISANPVSGIEPLEVFFDGGASFDLDGTIVSFAWNFDDGSTASGETAVHVFDSAGFYVVTLTVTDDEGEQHVDSVSIQVGADLGGGQRPGDGNQDGVLDIGDPVTLLFLLFRPQGVALPCEGATVNEGGNRTLMDVNSDGSVDTSDVVGILEHLFRGGPAPRGGAICVPVPGCENLCAF